MAITLITSPDDNSAVYNPNIFIFDSTNKGNEGFRYIFKIINDDGGDILVDDIKVSPRPGDGYGFLNVSKLLSNYVSTDMNLDAIEGLKYYKMPNFKLDYRLEVYEEYNTNWTYTDTEYVSGSITKLVSTNIHPFSTGNSISITPNDYSIRPGLSGLYQVVWVNGVSNNTTVCINAPWMTTPLNPGTVIFSDKRKTKSNRLFVSSSLSVYNIVFPFNKWNKTIMETYRAKDSNSKLLTNMPQGFTISSDEKLYIPYYRLQSETVDVKFTRDTGISYSYNFTNDNITHFDATPSDLFTIPTRYYDIQVFKGLVPMTEKHRINVVDKCRSEDYSILFEDRLGSFSSFSFYALSTKDITVKKETYNSPVEYDNNGEYDTSTTKGILNSTIEFDEIYTLRTRAMSYDNYKYFEELLTSDNTYIRMNGEYYPVQILTESLSTSKTNGKLKYREIRIKMSNKTGTNK